MFFSLSFNRQTLKIQCQQQQLLRNRTSSREMQFYLLKQHKIHLECSIIFMKKKINDILLLSTLEVYVNHPNARESTENVIKMAERMKSKYMYRN